MSKRIVDQVKEDICPVIESMGYEVVDIEYGKKVDGMNLTFYIDTDNGVNIEDCEKVHKAIDGLLDELNPTADVNYILNVSSPGLDRPIKTDRDLKRNIEKKIEVKLYAAINNFKLFKGVLKKYSSESIVMDFNGENIEIERSKISNILPVIEF